MRLSKKQYNSELIRVYQLFITISASFIIGLVVGIIQLFSIAKKTPFHGLLIALTIIGLVLTVRMYIIYYFALMEQLKKCRPKQKN